jgi:hypothetical protein
MRALAAFIGLVAIVGFGWVFSLPSKAECTASGRIVDPTERHCLSPTGYEQLQEHALFHSRDVVLGALLLLGIGFAGHRYWRRRRAHPSTASL